MSVTDELRSLLDEHGIEWWHDPDVSPDHTEWNREEVQGMMTHAGIKDAIEQLRELGCDGRIITSDIINVFNGNNFKVRDTLIELLEQADPDTHMELPIDADGEYIHIGDELVTNTSKKKFVVTRLKYSRKHAWMVGGADMVDLSEYNLYAPSETRHYHKPTVSSILDELEGLRGTGDYEAVVTRGGAGRATA